ncbi:MAG: hypothetical protein ACRDTG_19405 [Pseudonocardiaceae bacterium]
MKRKRKRKESRGLETRQIVYGDRRRPHARHQELKVDVRRGEVIDDDYAAAMVAARTTLPLTDVFIVQVRSSST